MATEQGNGPSELDLQAVETRLAALYADLPAAQQAVLGTVIAAGVEALAGADTHGYFFDLETRYQAQRQELEQAWRQADAQGHHDRTRELAEATTGEPRSVFRPLWALFRRVPAGQPQPSGGAPA